MSFPNISDILATTIESRTRKIADNVTKNNVILMKLESKGKMKPFSGGQKILQELSFASLLIFSSSVLLSISKETETNPCGGADAI
jgi:hypothetical protein